ncbi:MAG: phosphoglucosamine mutase [Candidatus Hydrogenedentes bacterium]|nr:phosphoglucosamine mutase [Candidatus Hydrogenedentota bacterium]
MSERLFGTDGIRGVANLHPITAEMALKVGRAAGHIFQKEDRPHTILIGKDTRQSGYMLENALTAGLCSMGVNVLLVGPLPTPGVSYIMRSLRCDAAIMISASHNLYMDNGIKFFGRDGFKLDDEVEDEIERLVTENEVDGIRPTHEHIGTARRIDDAVGRYIEFAKASFPKGMRLDGLRIVVDCAHGSAYKVGPFSFSELGADVIHLGNTPNGRNINMNCGSTHPEEMRAMVIRERADLGIAFDGDGDRIVMADSDGRLLDGNALLAILGLDLLERGELPNNTIATTIMANGGLERALDPLGGKILRTKVGDRYVVEAMREHGLNVGGESSGHIIMLEHNTTGDALITGLHVLATMIRKDQPLSELAGVYQPLPEAHTKVPHNGLHRPDDDQLEALQTEAETDLHGKGRVVIRASGTEPIIRIMVQHEVQKSAEALAKQLADRITTM